MSSNDEAVFQNRPVFAKKYVLPSAASRALVCSAGWSGLDGRATVSDTTSKPVGGPDVALPAHSNSRLACTLSSSRNAGAASARLLWLGSVGCRSELHAATIVTRMANEIGLVHRDRFIHSRVAQILVDKQSTRRNRSKATPARFGPSFIRPCTAAVQQRHHWQLISREPLAWCRLRASAQLDLVCRYEWCDCLPVRLTGMLVDGGHDCGGEESCCGEDRSVRNVAGNLATCRV